MSKEILENYTKETKQLNEKLLLEAKKIDEIFKGKNPEAQITYRDLFEIIQSLLEINYLQVDKGIHCQNTYSQIFQKTIDKIYKDMFKLHRIKTEKDLTNK